jgi:hypothetical protein
MNKMAKISICFLVIFAMVIPALADGPSYKSTANRMYRGGISIAQRTEGLLTGILRNTFSLFNPCLDVVKTCTGIVLKPVEVPLDYLDKAISKPARAKKAPKIPMPEKPELPKK